MRVDEYGCGEKWERQQKSKNPPPMKKKIISFFSMKKKLLKVSRWRWKSREVSITSRHPLFLPNFDVYHQKASSLFRSLEMINISDFRCFIFLSFLRTKIIFSLSWIEKRWTFYFNQFNDVKKAVFSSYYSVSKILSQDASKMQISSIKQLKHFKQLSILPKTFKNSLWVVLNVTNDLNDSTITKANLSMPLFSHLVSFSVNKILEFVESIVSTTINNTTNNAEGLKLTHSTFNDTYRQLQ